MKKLLLGFCLLTISLAPALWAQCGNCNPGGPAGDTPDNGTGGSNTGCGDPVNVYTGNEYQEIDDLQVWGGLGSHQLQWTRWGNSRAVGGNKPFGSGHYWRHGYQWELSTTANDAQGRAQVNVIYPSGKQFTFTQVDATLWRGTSACTEFLLSEGQNLVLQQADGMRYRFTRLLSGTTPYYLMTSFEDVSGNVYRVEYNSRRQVTKVTEPGGRFLQVSYQTVTMSQQNFVDLNGTTRVIVPQTSEGGSTTPAPIPASTGSSSGGGVPSYEVDPDFEYFGWTELKIAKPVNYHYVRLVGADGANVSVAEVEFYEAVPDPYQVVHTGNSASVNYDPNRVRYVKVQGGQISSDPLSEAFKAIDGNRNTVFTSSAASGGYVGYVLGARAKIGMVRYLVRPPAVVTTSYASSWGRSALRIQGGNTTPPATLSVISKVETSDGRSVSYNYTNYADDNLLSVWPTLTSVTYGDGTAAQYKYGQIFPGQIPMVVEYDNPRYALRMPRSKTVYQNLRSNTVLGMVDRQINAETGASILKIDIYNNNLHEPTATFANGAIKRFSMKNGTVGTETDGLGRKTNFTNDANGFAATRKDPLGRITQFEQGSYGHLLKKTYPDGSFEQWTRDDRGLELTYRDQLGRVTTTTRDARYRATRIDYPDASFEAFTYNAASQILTHTQRNGGTESFAYDARGLLIAKTDALGAVTTFGYDASDRLASVTDARGKTTQMAYNERGLITQITNPDGSTKQRAYDTYGNLIAETNELGQTWNYTFDQFKRMTHVTDPLGRTTRTDYPVNDLEMKPLALTLPSGKKTTISYDLVWNKVSQTVGAGSSEAATTLWTYSKTNQPLTVTDPLNRVSKFTYDTRDRQLTAVNALNQTTSWSYDAVSNVLSVKLPDNTLTTKSYDLMNRLLETKDALNQATTMAYDSAGNLVAMTDAKGNTYGYDHDLLNRPVGLTYPDGSTENYAYDAVGNRIGYRTRAGVLQVCAYDERNREIACDWADSTPDYQKSYDALGRLLTVIDSQGLTHGYSYDNANQLLSEHSAFPTPNSALNVGYSYNADGLRQTLTYPNGTVVSTEYTGRNQVSAIIKGETEIAHYTYDSTGNRVQKALANGTVSRYSYDVAQQLTQITHAQDNIVFNQIDYTLNNVGNRTKRVEDAKTENYVYDATQQVTGVTTANKVVSYSYDAVGNRQAVTATGTGAATTPGLGNYTTNNLNQYTSYNGASLSSDANGNLLTAPGAVFTFNRYDSKNRLISATKGLEKIEFIYDYRNRCVERSYYTGSELTQKVGLAYDGWDLIEEADLLNNTASATYVHGAGVDEIISKTDSSGTIYYHQDGLGSTTALSNEAGQIVERYRYDIFGQMTVLALSGLVITGSAYRNRFTFTGREWLGEIGLYDYRNRVYSTELGRFLQTDPILFQAGDVNTYRYCGNNGGNLTDPDGLMPLSKITSKGIVKILRSKTAHQLIQKGKNLIADSKKEAIRGGEKALPNKKIKFDTNDSTAKNYGPHAQPSPRGGNTSHIYDGNRTNINALRNIATAVTAAAYLGSDSAVAQTIDFFNPLAIAKDVFDVVDAVKDAVDSNDNESTSDEDGDSDKGCK